ncbi:MAG: DEAD/DEAH box helicase family protein, partial [Candidatus Dormibacteraeota bacterium]|nr:DEAD/DEAH box helicase family protein [Candidatus Dormibacteraeota bacterium]
PHRALSDAETTGELFCLLVERAQALPRRTLAEMRRVAAQIDHAIALFLSSVVRGPGGSAALHTRSRPLARDDALRTQLGDQLPPEPGAGNGRPAAAASDALPLDQRTAQLLGAEPFGGNDAFEYREEQVQMGRAVAQTLERRGQLLVEAATGIGKSRAYLAPLALWAAGGGGRAVVATRTVNLQEQLIDRELPALAAMVGRPVAAASLKGRNHYISLRRWERFLAVTETGTGGRDPERTRFALKVLVWLASTLSGDRSELHLTGSEEPFWRWIESDSDDCLGPACANWAARRCHMVAARAAAAGAAVVVTNHAMLLAASDGQGQLIGDYAALVVDEAHHLEAAATEQLGGVASGWDLALILERLPPGGGEVAAAVARCREAGQRLFGDLKGFTVQRLGGSAANARVGLTDRLRGEPAFVAISRSARHAVAVLSEAAATLDSADASDVQAEFLPQPERAGEELALAASALSQLAGRIESVLLRPQPGSVAWIELRGEHAELHEAPVSVAEPLRERLFSERDSVVLTSATLAVAGGFGFLRSRIGAGDEAEELILSSPFDYLSQALCVLPEEMPPYDDPAHEAAVARLVGGVAERLGGHTLVLFTSYGALRRVQSALRERLEAAGIAVLGQGIDGTRRQILRSFLADPRTVLLGTTTFWEGVDIPSERLRCVVIDKLPFPVPTDPLVQARSDGLSDAFGQYILPTAVLRLRQGFGRLIRSHADRGAVILCDERLSSRAYGEVFLSALPPATVARLRLDDVADLVDAFVRRAAPATVGEWTHGA